MRLDQNIEYGSYLTMITKFSVALVFVLCGIETDATDFISRQEFDEFKTNVFNHIQKLTLENDRQSVQIEHQRKTILDLMNSLAKYDEASTIFSPEDSTNISNDTVPLKHSRSFRNDSLISKPPAKETVKKTRLLTSQGTMTTVMADVVAFYAYLTNTETNPGPHHVIVYDHVVTNSGNGYNKHSGAFTVPNAGMYVFSWTTFVDPNSYFPIELAVNGHRAGIVFVHASTTFNGVTGSVVIQLQQDDVVMVRSEPGYNPSGNIYSDNKMKTTFSGWCISCSN